MVQKLKFGLAQVSEHAPRWLVYTTSVVAILMVAKDQLVMNIPDVSIHTKKLFIGWANYVLDVLQLVLAIAVIFCGQNNQNDHDTGKDQYNR